MSSSPSSAPVQFLLASESSGITIHRISKRMRILSPDFDIEEESRYRLNAIDPELLIHYQPGGCERGQPIFPDEIPIKLAFAIVEANDNSPLSTDTNAEETTFAASSSRGTTSLGTIQTRPWMTSGHKFMYRLVSFDILNSTDVKKYDVWKNLRMFKQDLIDKPLSNAKSAENTRRSALSFMEKPDSDLSVWGRVKKDERCQTCIYRDQACIVCLARQDVGAPYEVGSRCLYCQRYTNRTCSLILHRKAGEDLDRSSTADLSESVPSAIPAEIDQSHPTTPRETSEPSIDFPAFSSPQISDKCTLFQALLDIRNFANFLIQRILQIAPPDYITKTQIRHLTGCVKVLSSPAAYGQFANLSATNLSPSELKKALEAKEEMMSITAIFRSKLEVANGSPDEETKWVLSAMVRDLRKVEAGKRQVE